MLHKQQDEGYQKDNDIVPFCNIKAVLSDSLNMTSTASNIINSSYCLPCGKAADPPFFALPWNNQHNHLGEMMLEPN